MDLGMQGANAKRWYLRLSLNELINNTGYMSWNVICFKQP